MQNLKEIFIAYHPQLQHLDKTRLDRVIKNYLQGYPKLHDYGIDMFYNQDFTRLYIRPLFSRFLKENNLSSRYTIANKTDSINGWRQFPNIPIDGYISSAFDWGTAKNREIHWMRYHREWLAFIFNAFQLPSFTRLSID